MLFQAGQIWKSNEGLRGTEEGEDGDGWISLSGVGDQQGGHGAGGTGNCPITVQCLQNGCNSHVQQSLKQNSYFNMKLFIVSFFQFNYMYKSFHQN